MFVAKNLVFNGNGQIAINSLADPTCTGTGPSGLRSITVVRLVA
jgi:hypothetical protein